MCLRIRELFIVFSVGNSVSVMYLFADKGWRCCLKSSTSILDPYAHFCFFNWNWSFLRNSNQKGKDILLGFKTLNQTESLPGSVCFLQTEMRSIVGIIKSNSLTFKIFSVTEIEIFIIFQLLKWFFLFKFVSVVIFVRVTRMIVGSNVPVRLSNNLIEFALKGSWTWSVVVFADSKKESSRLVLPLPANKWSCLPPLRFWDLSSALQFLFLGDHRSFLLLLRVPDTCGWKLNLSLVNQSPALLHPATTFLLRLLTNQVSFGVESHIKFRFFFILWLKVLSFCFVSGQIELEKWRE